LTERFATLDENHNLVGGAAYELITDTIAGAAFRPDPSPQPLPLLLAEGLDPEKLDKVNQRINGIGVVIAVTAPEWIVDVEVGRTNNDATRAHASLVRLDAVDDDGTPTGVVLSLASVLPALPVLNAGSSELFITFSGDPLNGVNLADSGQGGAILDDQQENEQKAGKPPYKVDDVTVGTAEHLTRPPPLAYGLDYAARAFWVPNSGALPHQLRAEESDPFSPGDMKKHSDWPTDDDLKPYLRCTAISEITLEAAASNNRIGKVPEGVFPLAMDYPRRVISRFDDGSQTIDLFRRADGTGALSEDLLQETIPERETAAKVTLRDVHIDDNAKLVVEKWTDAGGPGERLGIEVDPNNHDIWHIRVDPGGGPFWLRLTLQSVGEGGNAACSFADPEQDTPGEGAGVASRESERPPAPLLLLGQNVSPVSAEEGEGKKEDKGVTWNSLHTEKQEVALEGPRVSFADFECWAENPTLMSEITGTTDRDMNRGILEDLRLARKVFEHFDPVYAQRMNRMPDPAVDRLPVTLAVSDTVVPDAPRSAPMNKEIKLVPYHDLERPNLIDTSRLDGAELKNAEKKNVEALKEFVKPIFDNAVRTVQINPGSDLGLAWKGEAEKTPLIVTVPNGQVAQFRVAATVPERYFESMGRQTFTGEMKRLSTGRYKEHLVFGNTALMIEGMAQMQSLDELKQAVFYPQCKGADRGYQLELDAKKAAGGEAEKWRQFGEVDVITQRWRPSGRPIYNWIDPVAVDRKNDLEGPVLEILTVGENVPMPDDPRYTSSIPKDKLDAFEADAFFDRSPDDAQRTRVRLVSLPDKTPMGRFEWLEASATYFRHRLSLRIRYAGAIQSGRTEIPWPLDKESPLDKNWGTRIAILADLGAANLTRPQVRALMPTLGHVHDSPARGAPPPMVCVLAEKPFGQMGLADRVSAGLETVHKYGFPIEKEALELTDLRREVGPDPRLSYAAVGSATSRGMLLRAEGPVGLHFDAPTTATPAFSNTQFMLHLDLNGGEARGDLEESFAGITLRRYVDPSWCWNGVPQPAAEALRNAAAGQEITTSVWWLDLEEGDVGLVLKDDDREAVRICQVGHGFKIEIAKDAAYPPLAKQDGDEKKDGGGPTGDGAAEGADVDSWVTLCQTDNKQVALLHQRLDGERFGLSVYAGSTSGEIVERGEIDRPQLVAALDWRATGRLSFEPSPAGRLRPTLASTGTFVEWVRTGRNLAEFKRLSLDDIDARLSAPNGDKSTRLEFRHTKGQEPIGLQSPVSARPYPLHVQRHLALVVRHASRDMGRQVGLFDQMVLADPAGGTLVGGKDRFGSGTSISIAEIETRAEPLLNEDASLGKEERFSGFKMASFDLVATRSEATTAAYRFFFRATNPKRPIKLGEVTLTITFTYDGIAKAPMMPMERTLEVESDSLTLWLMPKGKKIVRRMEFHGVDGTQENHSDIVDYDHGLIGPDTIALRLKNGGAEDPLWMDVSLLHSNLTGDIDVLRNTVDFDWFFGAASTQGSVAEAVDPVNLSRLKEVQARLIGISEPIKIR
jgi:hypothetical protein